MLELKDLIPRNMTINHVKSHAEQRKKKEHFTPPETLNSKVDTIILEKFKKPINTHIINTPIAVYINNKYHPITRARLSKKEAEKPQQIYL